MKKFLLPFIIFTNFSLSNSLNNLVDAFTISVGKSRDNIKIYRIGVRKDFSTKRFKSNIGYLGGYYELSLNYWNGKNSDNVGIAFSPVFAYYFNAGEFKPFVEASIGLSYFNKKYIDNRNLSTNFLFEDRIGIGFRYKNLEASFRFMHYSNGSIKQPNSGIDIWIGSISYKF